MTSATRFDALPDVPVLADYVPGYESGSSYGIVAPKGTPIEVVDKLNLAINTTLVDANMLTRLTDLGGTVLTGTPEQFGKLIVDETEKWAKIIRAANIKAE